MAGHMEIDGASVGADGLRSFLNATLEAEAILRDGRPDLTDAEAAECYRYLAGMLNFHVERTFKGFDVDRPAFVRVMDSFRSWGLPTPDHHYYAAQIDDEGVYRVLGQRGSTVDYCFEVVSGLPGDDGVVGERFTALESSQLHLDPDGRFELWVGGEPRTGNWMSAGPGARTIFVRQTINDWIREQPTPMLIERMDGPGRGDYRPRSAAAIQDTFARAGRGMVDQIRWLDKFARAWLQTLPLNEFPAPRVGPADAGYFPGQLNTAGRWSIATDEALLITLEPIDAAYQSLALGHPLWFNSIDARNVQSSLTAAQSRAAPNGVYNYLVASSDPGVWNWLDTGGLTSGFLFIRFQGIGSGRAPSPPRARLIKLSELHEHLEGERRVTRMERFEVLRARRLAADRRYF